MKKTVALIFGGEGQEREISVLSAKNLDTLIDRELYTVIYVYISDTGNWYIHKTCDTSSGSKNKKVPTFPLLIGGKSGLYFDGGVLEIDCAIPCLHGFLGEDGIIQGALRTAHISYVGEDTYAASLTSDKIYTKLVADALKIPSAKWIYQSADDPSLACSIAEEKIGYPMFVKPARQGSSYGAHPVYSRKDFLLHYENAKGYGDRVLIEELVSFEYELECGFFGGDEPRFSAGGRILFDGAFYDFGAKYNNVNSPTVCVMSGSMPKIERACTEYSKRLGDFIGIKNISRFDFFVTSDGRIFFNEINAFPGMTETSLYPRLCEDMGIEKGSFINSLIAKVCKNGRRI